MSTRTDPHTIDDGTTLEVSAQALRLAESIEIRQRAGEVVAPLGKDGIERVRFTENKVTVVSIETEDVESYREPDQEPEVLAETERDTVLEIVSLSFVKGNKWRFQESQDQGPFYASIDDADLLRGRAARPRSLPRWRPDAAPHRAGAEPHCQWAAHRELDRQCACRASISSPSDRGGDKE